MSGSAGLTGETIQQCIVDIDCDLPGNQGFILIPFFYFPFISFFLLGSTFSNFLVIFFASFSLHHFLFLFFFIILFYNLILGTPLQELEAGEFIEIEEVEVAKLKELLIKRTEQVCYDQEIDVDCERCLSVSGIISFCIVLPYQNFRE